MPTNLQPSPEPSRNGKKVAYPVPQIIKMTCALQKIFHTFKRFHDGDRWRWIKLGASVQQGSLIWWERVLEFNEEVIGYRHVGEIGAKEYAMTGRTNGNTCTNSCTNFTPGQP